MSFTKLMLVAFLAGLALCLQVTVWTLEVILEERQIAAQRKDHKSKKHNKKKNMNEKGGLIIEGGSSSSTTTTTFSTIKSSETTDAATLYLSRKVSPAASGTSAVAAAYWQIAVQAWLSTWDPNAQTMIVPLDNTTLPAGYYDSKRAVRDASSAGYFPTTYTTVPVKPYDDTQEGQLLLQPHRIVDALERAAREGHAGAQFHVAAAYAAGFWPLDGSQSPPNEDGTTSENALVVQDSWTMPTSKQQHMALLYWRMAAQQGHVESAMASAYRMETTHSESSPSPAPTPTREEAKISHEASCRAAMPIWEAAAAGVMDQLEADTYSRAKVTPATDKHELYLVHLHGGTSSQLEHYNRADESTDALQFYHLRAVNLYGTDAAAQAAFTLGQYYHHGLRGVPQNVTLAAEYYTMAAEQNHWEAAGQLGKLYLWGIGVPQDAFRAQRYFQVGVPAGLYDCQSRYTRLVKHKSKKNKADSDAGVSLCEANCLTGMALINLLGIPHVTDISLADAEAFLELAKDQGSSEASYNLAMFRMGWQQHWRVPTAVEENGQTSIMEEQVFNKDAPRNHPSHAEYQSILSDLKIAASKGHIQANFRLGLLYAHGVTIPKPGSSGNEKLRVIPKDCEKATKHFRWVVDHASPDRARRMRHAYKQYVAGDKGNSLRNYLAAAATGSETAQINAAFLLERGECPGLSNSVDCAKAAVRLWKAAAERGQPEASLRVGDFYYYGRLQPQPRAVGPFGWTRYLVFPEEIVPIAKTWFEQAKQKQFSLGEGVEHEKDETLSDCEAEGEGGTCAASEDSIDDEHSVQGDLEVAARYYQLAAAGKENARANFNLGFLYEWGLGLKQDFPLAKRHYDLAKSVHSRESDLPVVIALFTLTLHERFVKLYTSWKAWWAHVKEGQASSTGSNSGGSTIVDWPAPGPSHREKIPHASKKDKMEVIMNHIFSWDSLLILILTIIFLFLLRCGATR